MRYDKILQQWEDEWDEDMTELVREPLMPYLDETLDREWTRFCREVDDGSDNLFDWITPRIAVGRGPWRPGDTRALYRAGVTHVIDCRAESQVDGARDWKAFPNVSYLWAGFNDDFRHKPIDLFREPLQFAMDALRGNRKAKVFAHCAAGMNRGPSVAYGVLRAFTGMNPEDALVALRKARPIAFAPYRGDVDDALRAFGWCS